MEDLLDCCWLGTTPAAQGDRAVAPGHPRRLVGPLVPPPPASIEELRGVMSHVAGLD
jgi:hypothetical protein